VVGAHVQNAPDDAVKAKCKALGIAYPVVKPGFKKQLDIGIPLCLLFDSTGKCIFRGKPDAVEKQLRAAVGKSLVESLDEQPKSKSVVPLAASLKNGVSPVSVLQRALPLLKSKDSATADEAKQLVEKLCIVGQQQFEDAQKLKEESPFKAYLAAERLPAQYKGTPLGTRAEKLVAELKSDKAVMAEIKARPSLAAVKKIDETLSKSAALAKVEVTDPKFLKANNTALQNLKRTVLAMKKSWPDSKSTEEAVAIAEKYGIVVK
jgi:hypothetical protein